MTAYDFFCALPNDLAQCITTDLAEKKIKCNGRLLFDGSSLVGAKHLADIVTITDEELNSFDLISLADGESTFEVWAETVRQLYKAYASCVPQHSRHLHFIPAERDTLDIFALRCFHKCRLALELYLLFHGVQQDLQWRDPSHFYERITTGCVVYKSWITNRKG